MTSIIVFVCTVSMSAAVMTTCVVMWYSFLQNTKRLEQPRSSIPTDAVLRELAMEYLGTSRLQGQRLADNSQRLWQAASEAPLLPLHLLKAIEEIRDAARSLADTLESFEHLQPSSSPEISSRINSTRKPAQEIPTLSRREIAALKTQPNHSSDGRRHPFNCTKSAAPWSPEDPFPPASAFRAVKCREISSEGISFLWPDKPEFEHVVVSIGTADSPIYMAADVIHSKAVFMLGDVGYLLGCKFTKRLVAPAIDPRSGGEIDSWNPNSQRYRDDDIAGGDGVLPILRHE